MRTWRPARLFITSWPESAQRAGLAICPDPGGSPASDGVLGLTWALDFSPTLTWKAANGIQPHRLNGPSLHSTSFDSLLPYSRSWPVTGGTGIQSRVCLMSNLMSSAWEHLHCFPGKLDSRDSQQRGKRKHELGTGLCLRRAFGESYREAHVHPRLASAQTCHYLAV